MPNLATIAVLTLAGLMLVIVVIYLIALLISSNFVHITF